ncbi:MAG TPA: hypothetical protein VGP93_17570 [Polyangiaceae bacterium]|nr:hypothetical protein [Polyangiaceae bacterium]
MKRALAVGLLVPSLTLGAPVLAGPESEGNGKASLPAGRNEAILSRLGHIFETLRESKYSHTTLVDEERGRYEFDCSGLIAWVLRRSAPGAHSVVVSRSKNGRPLARDYYWEIASTRPGKRAPRGWNRIERVADARAGDVIAWLKPEVVRSTNTGHVAFLLEDPMPVPELEGGFLVRIADASQYQHARDDRAESGRTGFGSGVILLLADGASGAPAAYGWFGLDSRWVLQASMAIGRPVR